MGGERERKRIFSFFIRYLNETSLYTFEYLDDKDKQKMINKHFKQIDALLHRISSYGVCVCVFD